MLGELRTEGHKAMLHALLAVRAELTPEQRAQLREKMRPTGPSGRGGTGAMADRMNPEWSRALSAAVAIVALRRE